jgi:bifunctional non-homologous end joining protein LigD
LKRSANDQLAIIMEEKSVYLFCTEGGSNKEYHAHLRQMGPGWVVQFANGPRGRVGQTKLNSKTEAPKDFAYASKVFEDLVKSKQKSGYTPDKSGVRFTNTEHAKDASGHAQQLPTSIDEESALKLNAHPGFGAQEKANGERRTIEITESAVRGINKLGLYTNIPETWVSEFRALGPAVFDGEQIGEHFHVFDMLSENGKSLKELGFAQRYDRLVKSLEGMSHAVPSIKLLKTAFTQAEKEALLKEIETSNREGLVYKHLASSYDAGRSQAALKYKLLESSTCIVVRRNEQRSVQVGLLNASQDLVALGNVTIPANQPIPQESDLLEVQYLYFNPGGSFEQPTSLGIRNDITREECNFSQVTRLKPGVFMDENGVRDLAESQDQQTHEPSRDRPKG